MAWFSGLFRQRSGRRGRVGVSDLGDDEVARRKTDGEADTARAREEVLLGKPRAELLAVGVVDVTGELVSVDVGFDDELVVATSQVNPQDSFAGRDESPGFASFPQSVAAHTYSVSVTVCRWDGHRRIIAIEDLKIAHPRVQPLPDGGPLVVGARAKWRGGAAERNAVVVDTEGTAVDSFSLVAGRP